MNEISCQSEGELEFAGGEMIHHIQQARHVLHNQPPTVCIPKHTASFQRSASIAQDVH